MTKYAFVVRGGISTFQGHQSGAPGSAVLLLFLDIIKELRTDTVTKKYCNYRGADKSLARPGGKQATATEDFEFHISYL